MKKDVLLLIIFSVICSSIGFAQKNKKPEDVSDIGKVYHNITGKYNAYFNAREILREVLLKMETETEDNYNQILPLYPYKAGDTKNVESQLDEAIEKASIDISLHRVSNWADDCYFLIGQCQYLKNDYDAAEKTLEYLTQEYSPEAIEKKEAKRKGKKVKKKKEKTNPDEEKPESYFLKHRPVYENGMLWLAKSYVERERYDDASLLLTKIEKNPKTHKMFFDDIAEVRTYSYLKQKDYDNAVEPLKQLLELSKKRSNKARYAYILAQIHQNAGRGDEAYAAFKEVLKYGPKYDMEFNTRLSMAQNSWLTGRSNANSVIQTLDKMLKDAKNKEYKDQIYFALAKVYLKEKDFDNAKKHLKLSIANNIDNQAQKTESYLQLASIYYDSEDYVNASLYYDSTLLVLPVSDERFELVRNRGTSLKDIAENILIIELQDSLIAISKMSDEEKKALALELKKQNTLKEVSAIKKSSPAITSNTLNTKSSSFFAYNPKLVKKGKREFEKKWGTRILEDDWRRSNKSTSGEIVNEDTSTSTNTKTITDEEVKKLLKDIPDTPEKLEAANKVISDAMFNLGILYKDRLEHEEKCIETLTNLLSRYPKTENRLEALYYIYLSYKQIPNMAKAKVYANKIVDEYPNSKYAKVLSDPNYLTTLQQKNSDVIDYYDKTYSLFTKEQYKEANERISKSNELFGNKNTLKAKFALLGAFCKGKLEGKDEYVRALKAVTVKHPNTEEEKRAKEILRYLDVSPSKGGLKKADPNEGKTVGKYKVEKNATHYFLISFKNANENLDEIKAKIKSYHDNNYTKSRLRVSSIFLGNTTRSNPIFVVRRFIGGKKAMDYHTTVLKDKAAYLGKNIQADMFPVSQNNYRQILKQKNLDGYLEFFKEIYQK